VAEIEAIVQPDCVGDYIGRKSVAFVCIHTPILAAWVGLLVSTPAKGKDFDNGLVLGPCIVTKDELPLSPEGKLDLEMIARVNGEEWGRGRSGDMTHDFPAILERVSESETLYPGEVIGSGTVGNGCGIEHGKFLGFGDVVELEIETIGKIRNKIVEQ